MSYPIKCHHEYIIGDFEYMLKLRWQLPLMAKSTATQFILPSRRGYLKDSHLALKDRLWSRTQALGRGGDPMSKGFGSFA